MTKIDETWEIPFFDCSVLEFLYELTNQKFCTFVDSRCIDPYNITPKDGWKFSVLAEDVTPLNPENMKLSELSFYI